MTDQQPTPSSTSQRALSIDAAPVPAEFIEQLFERLAAIVGKEALERVYGGLRPEVVKAEWGEALNGYSIDELKRGLAAMRARRFPPALNDFVLAARPGLDPETAWNEAERGIAAHDQHEAFAWSHPAVYWAAAKMRLEVRGGGYRFVSKRWAGVLAAEFAKGAWASPPDPTQRALPHQPAPPTVDPHRVRIGKEALRVVRRNHTGFATRADEDLATGAGAGVPGALSPEARAALIAAGAPGTSAEPSDAQAAALQRAEDQALEQRPW